MKLTFIGADHEVTGSCHLLSACGKNILIDYGMEQGKDYFENVPIPVSAPRLIMYFSPTLMWIIRVIFLFYTPKVSGEKYFQPTRPAICAT